MSGLTVPTVAAAIAAVLVAGVPSTAHAGPAQDRQFSLVAASFKNAGGNYAPTNPSAGGHMKQAPLPGPNPSAGSPASQIKRR
jgi:hypothetical protein